MRFAARRLLSVAALTMLCMPCLGEGQAALTNGGFEEAIDGRPRDWEVLGEGQLSSESHSGAYAFLMIRPSGTELAETGLNRAWSPGSGAQGAMLDMVQGAVTFWYRVLQADADAAIRINIIPMTEEPLEDVSASRAYYQVPKGHVGDGEWHRGALAYDFRDHERVRWVQVSPRITGGGAQCLVDDFEWTDHLGPFLALDQVEILEGRRILRARLSNLGDEPVATPRLQPQLPPGMAASEVDKTPVPDSLAPGQWVRRHWRLSGPAKDQDTVLISALGLPEGWSPIEEELRLSSEVRAYSLMVDPPVLEPGQEATVTLGAKNYGAADSEAVRLEVSLPDSLELVGDLPSPEPIGQGQWARHEFRVRARSVTPAAVVTGVASTSDERWDVATSVVVAPAPGPDTVTIQTGEVRLLIARSPWGAGPAHVEVRRAGRWSPIGWLPHLGRIATIGADGQSEVLTLGGEPTASPEGVSLRGSVVDSSGATWHSEVDLMVRGRPGLVGFRYRVRCDRDRPVQAFEGPMLVVSAQEDEGLLPGVEWVEGEDETSSNRDLALSVPDRLRFVPDGYDITIPLMAVRGAGVTTALLWDVHQRWDRTHDKPAVCFSRPGYLAGTRCASMGIFAPSIGDGWLQENQLRAGTPYPLQAGQYLRLEADLLVRTDSTTILDAVDEWLQLHGPPQPGPPPRGDWVSEVEFSTRAYTESLYDAAEGDWWQSKGGGPLLSPKVKASPHFAWDLERAARLTDDPEKAEAYREWAARMTEIAGQPPQGFDGGLEYADGSGWLAMVAGAAKQVAATQREDGSWGYDADRRGEGVFAETDYWELGDLGESELGTNARPAMNLLRYARATGDYSAYEAGVRALQYMDRFRVPRAGQVWEVPVHVPDIIAASDAIEAYVEAYRLDGNPHWIDCAVYWAMAGVPFVYLWGEAERPYLSCASIAVYGGTFRLWNWIGRPVQWCGLNYAAALHQLAEFDDTQDWKRIAEGVLISALHQQGTDDEDVALWPDSIGAREGDKSAWLFAPSQLYEHLYTMLGLPSAPRTTIVGQGPDRLHIHVVGDVTTADYEGGELALDVRLHPKGRSSVLVGPMAPPDQVAVDGVPVSRGGGPTGWTYIARYRALSVPLQDGGDHRVVISNVKRAPLPEPATPVYELAFSFDASDEGWMPENAVSLLSPEDGALVFEVTGTDPYIVREAMSVPTYLGDRLRIRMSLDTGGTAQVFWATEDAPGLDERRSFHFTPVADGQMHEYVFPVGLHPEWPGRVITTLRIDPTDRAAARVAIDRIELERAGP